MEIRRFANNVLLVAAVGLLLWQGMRAPQPAVVTAMPVEPVTTGSISVSGSSAIRVQPDRVVVLFGVETFAATPSASHALNARRSHAVIEAIHDLDISERHIATANFTIHPRYDDYDRNIISGYGSRNTIAVTLQDVQKLEPVLITALEAGATTVDGIDFSITNLRALRDKARTQAIQAALEKAEDMAQAANLNLGSVTNIHEDSWSYHSGSWRGDRQWTNYQNVVQDLSAQGAITLEDGSISLGQIVVQAQVSLTAQLAVGQ
jgi:uncharacterized protein YggE